jgi:hypothetical protein
MLAQKFSPFFVSNTTAVALSSPVCGFGGCGRYFGGIKAIVATALAR